MTVEIGNIIIAYLAPLTYIDKLAGVVKSITKTDLNTNNNPTKKIFPVACGISYNECLNTGKYQDLIPNSNIGCMVYLEDSGVRLVGLKNGFNYWNASYKLVGWINQKKLGYDTCSITSQIIQEIISKFPEIPTNNGIFQQVKIQVDAQDPKSFNPFSKYSYEEDKTQYLMFPFDYFSLNITVSFAMNKKCLTPFITQTPLPC